MMLLWELFLDAREEGFIERGLWVLCNEFLFGRQLSLLG